VKIAAITDDGQTLSQHFGRARYFLVVTVEDGKIVAQELRDKAGHHIFAPHEGPGHDTAGPHGFDPASQGRHAQMLAAIADCQVVLAGGMGQGMYGNLQQVGIRPVLTAEMRIEQAIRLFLDGRLAERPELAH
jgi:predicted Fe-Mo cluster-binding NifX family protein